MLGLHNRRRSAALVERARSDFRRNLDEDKSPWLYDSSRKTPLFTAGRNYNADRAAKTDTFLGHFDPNVPNFPENIRWGLVWDGDSPHTLSGPTGLYQRYNQPHKFSLYLAAGIPVICHKDAAVAALVKQWKVGLSVNSIDEIPDAIKSLDSVDEAAIRDGVAEIGRKIRAGYFLSEALADFIEVDAATESKKSPKRRADGETTEVPSISRR